MEKIFFKILFFISLIYSFDIDEYKETYLNNGKEVNENKNNQNKFLNQSQILYDFIDEEKYVTGPGDVFLFNMITTNGIVDLELIVSPSGKILIPVVGIVDVKSKKLNDVYKIIRDKCKERYEDAYVYINLIKIREFKVLLTGETIYAGMHTIASTDRVSDLIESLDFISPLDTLLSNHVFDFPDNIVFNKDIFLIRNDSIIFIDLFDYYINGNFSSNPKLIEGDNINIENSNKITLLGEVLNPVRLQKTDGMTYNNVLNEGGGVNNNADITKIKFFNYKMISKYSNKEINRIFEIDPKYRNDIDESFLNSRNKTSSGMIYIKDNLKLEDFLNSEVSKGDVIIVPQKVNYVEILGGVNNPGTYLYYKDKNIYDYVLSAGNFNNIAKTKNIYIVDVVSGTRIKVNNKFKPNSGDIIFIEEKLGFKKWDRISENIKLAGTIATMSLVLFNIWDKLSDE